MNNDRTFKTATANNQWQNVGALMADIGMNPLWDEVTAHVLESSVMVLVAATNDSRVAPSSDNFANTVEPGSYEAFRQLSFNHVWIKSPDGASSIEFRGTPLDNRYA